MSSRVAQKEERKGQTRQVVEDAGTPTRYEAAIRAELEATRDAFYTILAAIPNEAWEKAVGDGEWNVREILFHLVFVDVQEALV